jgi:hypothetical protein
MASPLLLKVLFYDVQPMQGPFLEVLLSLQIFKSDSLITF